ncbi:MAG: TatD family hydrolase [Treponema sp.]|jgi:TatD DNase family protein|nr:TatD family hydrolase [Treponema sp.]
MLTDAHCHPFDLAQVFPEAEEERRRLGVIAASSACDMEEFAHCEGLAKKAAVEGAAPLLPCFAIHPQLPAAGGEKQADKKSSTDNGLTALFKLAGEGRIAAIGECGFDLYNERFRETEKIQEYLFAQHLETALRYDLPVVIHARRAMHKIFANAKILSKCRTVVFHSWSGTLEEGQALLRRKVNAYFSFGNAVMNGHKKAMHCCAAFPVERLLTETDAPFQPQRGQNFSWWADLSAVIKTAASLRGEAESTVINEKDLETQIEANFRATFAV